MANKDDFDKIFENISLLQKTEQELFNQLDVKQNLTEADKKEIVNKINNASQMRIQYYNSLSSLNKINNSFPSFANDQANTLFIVEDELNQTKQKQKNLSEEVAKQLRQVEINSYFGSQYNERIQFLTILVYTLLPITALSFVFQKGFIPTNIFIIITGIISAIGAYYGWFILLSLYYRDNMNYNSYAFHFKTPKSTATSSSFYIDPNAIDVWSSGIRKTCVGQLCCSNNQLYDETIDKCVSI
jgi:hypothetical protein